MEFFGGRGFITFFAAAAIALSPAFAAETPEKLQELANTHFRNKDYAKAIDTGKRYFAAGGGEARMHGLLGMAYFATNDFTAAVAELHAEVQGHEKLGQAPPEDRLQTLAKAYSRLNNDTGYLWTLERLVTYYPKKEHWADLLARLATKPGVGDRLLLDLFRLKLATGTLTSGSDHMKSAQLALDAGFPVEARNIVEHGFRTGLLGTGADAERHKQLRDLVTTQAAEQRKKLPGIEADARARKDKESLLNAGFAYVTQGEHAKGLSLMEEGLRMGALNKQGDAKLHLGIAYALAGQRSKAIDVWKTVRAIHGSADLARLWVLHIRNPA